LWRIFLLILGFQLLKSTVGGPGEPLITVFGDEMVPNAKLLTMACSGVISMRPINSVIDDNDSSDNSSEVLILFKIMKQAIQRLFHFTACEYILLPLNGTFAFTVLNDQQTDSTSQSVLKHSAERLCTGDSSDRNSTPDNHLVTLGIGTEAQCSSSTATTVNQSGEENIVVAHGSSSICDLYQLRDLQQVHFNLPERCKRTIKQGIL
jgi:hypothetical protein